MAAFLAIPYGALVSSGYPFQRSASLKGTGVTSMSADRADLDELEGVLLDEAGPLDQVWPSPCWRRNIVRGCLDCTDPADFGR